MQRNLFIGYGFIGYGVFSLGACIPEPTIGSDTASMDRFTDIDGDGWTIEEGDCWEGSTQPTLVEGALSHSITSADIYPGARDFWYDGIDSNCDKQDDFDQDGDGFVPSEYEGIETLGIVGTGLLSGNDCDDENAARNPGAEEQVADGIDSDCDDKELCLRDQDGDGYSDGEVIATVDFTCQGYGLTLLDGDCDVANPNVHPDQEEACDGIDTNCDGELWSEELDADGDGYVSCFVEADWLGENEPIGSNDCDDSEPEYHVEQLWYADTDGDGYGVETGLETMRCTPHFHYTALEAGDCAPSDSSIHPNAEETNDGVDDNCDGLEASGYSLCKGTADQSAYFLMCFHPSSVSSAESICQQHGYDGLASILSASENTTLQSLDLFLSGGAWLSASDQRTENSFLWGTGDTMQYTNWYGNHPNVNGLQDNCLTMGSDGKWREVACSQGMISITCEKRY